MKTEKTTQAAAALLKAAGGELDYIVLLKLLYYADRTMLTSFGIPMTMDRWYATKCGPILSSTYDLIKGSQSEAYWTDHIETRDYKAILTKDPGDEDLSRAEQRIIDTVYREHGDKEKWEIGGQPNDQTDLMDRDQQGSHEITYREVLEVEGLPLPEIERVLENIEAERYADQVLKAR